MANSEVDRPGKKIANDPTVIGNALYVSDNRGDWLYRVEPADFLKLKRDLKPVSKGIGIGNNGTDVA